MDGPRSPPPPTARRVRTKAMDEPLLSETRQQGQDRPRAAPTVRVGLGPHTGQKALWLFCPHLDKRPGRIRAIARPPQRAMALIPPAPLSCLPHRVSPSTRRPCDPSSAVPRFTNAYGSASPTLVEALERARSAARHQRFRPYTASTLGRARGVFCGAFLVGILTKKAPRGTHRYACGYHLRNPKSRYSPVGVRRAAFLQQMKCRKSYSPQSNRSRVSTRRPHGSLLRNLSSGRWCFRTGRRWRPWKTVHRSSH